MIVRADMGRGLAHQTLSFYQNLRPEVTVVIDMALVDPAGRWPQDFSLYPGAIQTQWRGYTAPFENPEAIAALSECDIVFSAETYYDERVPRACKTILHVNPEFYRGQPATAYWYPTPWRIEDLPPGHLVPTPIEDERIRLSPPGPGKALFVGGHHAAGDRAGAHLIRGLMPSTKAQWRITSQDGQKLSPRAMMHEVWGRTDDRWSLYEGASMLVYPRRYGGQSLVVNEAAARGLAVIMGDQSPNLWFPIVPIPARPAGFVKTPGGKLQMHLPQTALLGETVNLLAQDPELLETYQVRSLLWARDNSWSEWAPKIKGLIEDAC